MIDLYIEEKHRNICPSCGSNYSSYKCSREQWRNNNCFCFEQNKRWRDYTLSGIPNTYFSKDIEDYHLKDLEQNKNYYKDVKKYIQYLDLVYKSGSSLYLHNQLTSTGKTFFAISILKEAYRKDYSIQFLSLLKIQNELYSNRDLETFLKNANKKDFLVLDSIDRELRREFLVDLKLLNYFEQFLKERYKPIIFTSSCPLDFNLQIVKTIKGVLKDRLYEINIDTPIQYLDGHNYWNNILNYKKEQIK